MNALPLPETILGVPPSTIIPLIILLGLAWMVIRLLRTGLGLLRGRMIAVLIASMGLGATGGYTIDNLAGLLRQDSQKHSCIGGLTPVEIKGAGGTEHLCLSSEALRNLRG